MRVTGDLKNVRTELATENGIHHGATLNIFSSFSSLTTTKRATKGPDKQRPADSHTYHASNQPYANEGMRARARTPPYLPSPHILRAVVYVSSLPSSALLS
ncbi:hypothetical protein ONS95_015037 [Cadophora gregata]|uniref:uncharacterized protein n=1 Tax=Cadophora gregata TaxID=51156 RepID=UPI0026DDA4C2|nr:uncharacterized protein ONS95_015037 [Cadophora gregata]KAK0101230.1 hypothetical protein ONS95_015037 [Cadophora gregata]